MDKFQVLQSFWEGFGLPAYDADTVPDEAQLPYITYSPVWDDFGQTTIMNASIWYRSSKWAEITRKAEQISDMITRGGKVLNYDSGALWIKKGTPWAQRMGDPEDDSIRRILLNIEVEYFD